MDDVYGRAGHDRAMISHSAGRKDEGFDSGGAEEKAICKIAIDYAAHGAVGTQVVLEASRQLLINISTRRS
jgi:hypothetical protein